ncbi:hypothetical protein [Microcoleus sp. N9_A2]|uniref:hypothetical protein n=1 Tax=Microcoleus sp. N9_A2 TaxID=3055381 RepID=UPI002FD2F325
MPAFIASNGAGIIGLIPYLLLRQPQPEFSGRKDMLIKISDSRFPLGASHFGECVKKELK